MSEQKTLREQAKTITVFCDHDGHYWIKAEEIEKVSGLMMADSSKQICLVSVEVAEAHEKAERDRQAENNVKTLALKNDLIRELKDTIKMFQVDRDNYVEKCPMDCDHCDWVDCPLTDDDPRVGFMLELDSMTERLEAIRKLRDELNIILDEKTTWLEMPTLRKVIGWNRKFAEALGVLEAEKTEE